MSPWNRSVHRPQSRALGLQSLDDRWLPTGLGLLPVSLVEPALPIVEAVTSEVTAVAPIALEGLLLSSAAIEVVEIALTPAVEIVASTPELPNRLAAALDDAFPGWTQAEGDTSTDLGATEYAVNADWNGVPVELTLTENGQISEVAQDLAPSELPKPFKDWVGENFPGAVTDKVARVIDPEGVSYDLKIVTAAGSKIEATLRYDRIGTQPVADSSNVERAETTNSAGDSVADSATMSWIHPADSNVVAQTPQSAAISESGSQPNQGASSPGATQTPARDGGRGLFGGEEHAAPPNSSSPSPEGDAPGPVDESPGVLRDLAVTLSEVGPAALLTPFAGTLYDLSPIDAAAVERGLNQFVDGIDSLAESISTDMEVQGIASWGALIAAFLAGSWVSIRHASRTRLAPTLRSISAGNSWSWIVGSGTPTRLTP